MFFGNPKRTFFSSQHRMFQVYAYIMKVGGSCNEVLKTAANTEYKTILVTVVFFMTHMF